MPDDRAPAQKPSALAKQMRERLRQALNSGMGELDLRHADVADGCGVGRQVVSIWVSPHHESSPSLAFIAVLTASTDERLRTLGLRLLREAAAFAEADLVDLREADEGDLVVRLATLDREGYEGRASIAASLEDGHQSAEELEEIIRQNDEAATAHRREVNRARALLKQKREDVMALAPRRR